MNDLVDCVDCPSLRAGKAVNRHFAKDPKTGKTYKRCKECMLVISEKARAKVDLKVVLANYLDFAWGLKNEGLTSDNRVQIALFLTSHAIKQKSG
jgi:hypothetical protein